MKKIIGLFLLILCCSAVVAQSEDVPLPKNLQVKAPKDQQGQQKAERKMKFVAGGTIGFGVNRSELNLKLAPHFGICPGIDFLCIGVGGTYYLNYYKDPFSGLKQFTHIYGFGGFVEGYVWDRLVLHAEYEWLRFPALDETSHGVLLGPGYKQNVSDMVSVYGHILFPVYETLNGVYGVVEMRVGVNVTF